MPINRASLHRLFSLNPARLLQIMSNKVDHLRKQVRELSLDLAEHETLLREFQLRHTHQVSEVETLSTLGLQIACLAGPGAGAMSPECTTRLLEQYLQIMEERTSGLPSTSLEYFVEQYIPSLMATLADLNDQRCPDDPSTWVTGAEMHARQFVNPFSDQRD